MLVDTKQMLPVSQLQKTLPRTIRSVRTNGNAFYVVENNTMEAVLLSYKEYEYLRSIAEILELSIRTVERHLYLALKDLRKTLHFYFSN